MLRHRTKNFSRPDLFQNLIQPNHFAVYTKYKFFPFISRFWEYARNVQKYKNRNSHPAAIEMTPDKLINLLIRSNKGHYLQRRTLRQSRALPEVTCMPIGLCACIYGTLGSHFEQFGFISPTQANCLSENGLVLCIENVYMGS